MVARYQKISLQGRSISNRVEGHLSLIRKVILTSARAILPVYRTTPSPALFRETGLLPPELQLNKKSRQAIIRSYHLDPRHPLKKRIIWIGKVKRQVSRLSDWVLNLPEIEHIDPLISPPWFKKESAFASIKRVSRHPFPLPNGIPLQDLAVYTDASRVETSTNPRAGGGIIIFQAGQVVLRKCVPLSPTLTTFDAEVAAAAKGVEEALRLPTSRFSNDL